MQSNAHLNISHPFSAKHDTSSGSTQKQKSNSLGRKITLTDAYAAMPLEARMYQKNSTELRPSPRKADAPLEERLYPNKQDARTGIEYPHWAKNISSELPLPPHEGSYYRIAKRPLDYEFNCDK